jgi:hypothetical protein
MVVVYSPSSLYLTVGTAGYVHRSLPTASTDSTVSTAQFVLQTFPWAAALPGDELMAFATELGAAILRWHQTRDAAALDASVQLVGEWQATAEAYQNSGLQAALADTHDEFVAWE